VVGDTPNVAARLQALAEPGQVVVAEHSAAHWRALRVPRSRSGDAEGAG
jgi:class 3 adenylate cyclase